MNQVPPVGIPALPLLYLLDTSEETQFRKQENDVKLTNRLLAERHTDVNEL